MTRKRFTKKQVFKKNRFNKFLLQEEREYVINYGLRNKKELRRAYFVVKKYKTMYKENIFNVEFIQNLKSLLIVKGYITEDQTILDLNISTILKRRLQSFIFFNEKFLIKTIKEARQKITHGHVKVNGKVVKQPSFLLVKSSEEKIEITL